MKLKYKKRIIKKAQEVLNKWSSVCWCDMDEENAEEADKAIKDLDTLLEVLT